MADVAPARGKRARSPSPGYVDTLASPLEVLLKRRRRSEWASATGFGGSSSSNSNNNPNNGGNSSGSSGPGRMFAPPPPPPIWQTNEEGMGMGHSNLGDAHAHAHYDGDNSSQAATSSPLRRHTTGYDDDDSGERGAFARRAVERRRARQWERLQDPSASVSTSAPNTTNNSASMYAHHHSHSQQHLPLYHQHHSRSAMASPADHRPQATPERHNNRMSSSPVRHNPPSSTPFRADDEWTEDERMREWGDEYAAQNSVLHSLHRARMEALSSNPPTPADNPLVTPASQRIAAPRQATPYGVPTPYRHRQRTPLETPSLMSSDYASSPFRDPYSPLNGPSGPAPSPVHGGHAHGHEADAVRTGYEETNRLLAALNMARLRRYESESQSSPLGSRAEHDHGNEAGMMVDD